MSALREDSPVEVLAPEEVTEDTPASAMIEAPGGAIIPVGHRFTKDNQPQGRGRPKGLARRIRDMVGDDPARIANVLFDILEDEKAKDSDRISAAKELFDRGWGRAPAFAPIEGGDPLESSELDKAIRDIADQLIARRAHPILNAKLTAREIEEGFRPEVA